MNVPLARTSLRASRTASGRTIHQQRTPSPRAETVVDSGTSLSLYALWGARPGDVWAAGSGGVVRHFTRQADGEIVTEDVPFPSRATIRTLSGFAANDIWAAGSDGMLAHWDGATWSLVDLDTPLAGDSEIFRIWASGPEDVWAVGRNTFLHKGSRLLPGTLQ